MAKYYYGGNDFFESVEKTLSFLQGANVFVALNLDEPDKLIVANKGGSIVLGSGEGYNLVLSCEESMKKMIDKKIVPLKSNEIAIVKNDSWQIFKANQKKEKIKKEKQQKIKYPYFMLKEVMEQPDTFLSALRGRIDLEKAITKLGGLEELINNSSIGRELSKINTFHFIGCGTAYNACLYGKMLFNRFGIKAEAHIASEYCYSHQLIDSTDAFVFISQSGETADSLEVLNEIKIKGNISLGIINVVGSRMWRETDAGIGIRAGLEKGVASTKAYTSQLASVVLLAVYLARQRNMTIDTGQRILNELENIPEKIENILNQAKEIKSLAKKYSKFKNYYFLGRHFNSINSMEGSLKLKEISYVHSESYPLGEMKHGPLALIDENFCSVVTIPDDGVFNKSLVNIHEIKGREGTVLSITNTSKKDQVEKLSDDTIVIPETIDYLSPILSVIPLQLFSYFMSLEYGFNPDKPRNLAKTVTVL